VCCASAGVDRPEYGICAGPAYVVIPTQKKTHYQDITPDWPLTKIAVMLRVRVFQPNFLEYIFKQEHDHLPRPPH
jgi:hypothetical protein